MVSFDAQTADSKINAEYYLYRREGAAIRGDVTYYHLFLGYDLDRDLYDPATYIVGTLTYICGGNVFWIAK